MNDENINSLLLEKLINVNYNGNNVDKEYTLSYLKKIIKSDIKIQTYDESIIINSILEKMPSEKVNRLQILLQRLFELTDGKLLKNRWSILYFLGLISNSSLDSNFNKAQDFKSGNFFSMINFTNNNNVRKKDIDVSYSNEDEEKLLHDMRVKNTLNPKNQNKTINLVVNKYKSNKIITEKDIIIDLIYVFQGIDGDYIHYNEFSDSYQLTNLIPFTDGVISVVNNLSEMGWMYRKLKMKLDKLETTNVNSKILQAFICSLRNELNQYYK